MKKIIFTLSMILLCLTLSAQKGGPSQLCIEGLNHVQMGEAETALQCFRQDLKNNPKAGYSFYGEGLAYLLLKQYDESIAAFHQAQKLLPKADRYAAYRDEALVYVQKNDYEKALAIQAEAIKANPNESTCYLQRAQLYSLMEYYSLAIPDYRKAIELNPQDLEAYYELSSILMIDNLSEAMEICERALAIDRRNVYLITQHAQLKCEAGKYEEALNDLVSAISLGSWIEEMRVVSYTIADTLPDVFLARMESQQNKQYSTPIWSEIAANVCLHLERPKSAQKYQATAYEINGPDPETLWVLCEHDRLANDYDAAIRHLNELKRDWPEYDSVFNYDALTFNYHYSGCRFNEIVRMADSMHRITPNDTLFWLYLTDSKLQCGQIDEAIQIYNTAIDTCQELRKPYNQRAYAYLFFKKDTAAAIADFRKAIEIDTNRVFAYYMLGDKQTSLTRIKQIHNLNTTDGAELYDIAQCYSLIGESQLALRYLRMAFEHGWYWGESCYLEHDFNLYSIRDLPEYKKLIDEYEAKAQR